MSTKKRIELNKYASSSFSGADIRVIANLNTYGFDSVKKEIVRLREELRKFQASKTNKLNSRANWETIRKDNLEIQDGGALQASYDTARTEIQTAEDNVRAQQLVVEALEGEEASLREALADAESAWQAAHAAYLDCLSALPTTDTSSCDALQNDDWDGTNRTAARAALDAKEGQIILAEDTLGDLKLIVTQKQEALDAIKGAEGELETNIANATKSINFITEELGKLEEPMRDLMKRLAEFQKILSSSSLELGTVQTISCQAHRPKAAVRALGSSYARGYTRGPRTIAGSMIFTVINKQSLGHLCNLMSSRFTNPGNDILPSTILPDQLLPLDLTFIMANEYGAVSRMALYGLEFLNTGYTFSIEDLLLEEVVQFVARDIDPMSSVFDPQNHQKSRQDTLSDKPITGKETLRGYLIARQKTLDRRRF